MPSAALPDIALFHGRLGLSPGERLVETARRAAGLDVLARLTATGRYGRQLIVTDDPALVDALQLGPAIIEPSGPAFHFGRRLTQLVVKHRCQHLLYVGAGSGLLTTDGEWHALADLLATPNLCAANNYLSADYIAFAPAMALTTIDPPTTDNDLPWRLVHQAGLTRQHRPRQLGGEVDIDTPTDIALLSLSPDLLPPRLAAVIASPLATTAPSLTRLLPALDDPEARLLVAGRVNATAWLELERATMRYTRLISEERGMRASGRLARGEVRSLLGSLLDQYGPVRFFDWLAEICDVALLDTRVLFAHLQRQPSTADRFASDRLAAAEIVDPLIQAFTTAAAAAPIPVLLGGHSLVSGGLWLLAHYLRHRRPPTTSPPTAANSPAD